jgi:hypothetical protein
LAGGDLESGRLDDAAANLRESISICTVRSHPERIRDKAGCCRRADLTRPALTTGII